jgi:L-aminopeptidase/D-esterase-like protein
VAQAILPVLVASLRSIFAINRDRIWTMPPGFLPIQGLKIGHAQDDAALTGCTVLLCEEGMVAACEVRGGAAGERELETLRPGHLMERIHALVFAGGSAFGLEAAAGVMRWLEERGIGFSTGVARVPIVPAAILFDLRVGDPHRRPDAAMGYVAAQAAAEANPDALVGEGNVGAGTGLTVGKLFGITRATKSGIGCWTEDLPTSQPERARVAALAAVNAFGDVRDPDTGLILAGARVAPGSPEFADTAAAMRQGASRAGFADPSTVLVAVATNVTLSRLEAQRLATMAAAGMARVISPAHTTFDGDIVFALSIGEANAARRESSPRPDLNALGAAAAEAVARAIARGVTQARPVGGIPAAQEQ